MSRKLCALKEVSTTERNPDEHLSHIIHDAKSLSLMFQIMCILRTLKNFHFFLRYIVTKCLCTQVFIGEFDFLLIRLYEN